MNNEQLLSFEGLLETLIKMPTIYDPKTKFLEESNLVKGLKLLLNIAQDDGFKVTKHDYFGLIKTDTNFEKTITLFFHLDVVKVANQAWDHDPFTLTKKDGGYFGRGVMDDKGPLALVYTVLKYLDKSKLQYNIELFIGLDEESSFKCIKQYNQLYSEPDLGLVVDAKFPVIFGEKGSAHVKVDFKIDELIKIIPMQNSYNVVVEKVEYYKSLEKYITTGIEIHSSKSNFNENSVYKFLQEVLDEGIIMQMQSCFSSFKENKLGKTVVNPTFITQKDDIIEVYFDIRFTTDDDIKTLNLLFNQEIVITKPMKFCYDQKMVEQLLTIYQKHSHDLVTIPRTSTAGTYSAYLNNTYVYGFELIDQVSNVHQANEFLSSKNVEVAFEIYEDLMQNLKIY